MPTYTDAKNRNTNFPIFVDLGVKCQINPRQSAARVIIRVLGRRPASFGERSTDLLNNFRNRYRFWWLFLSSQRDAADKSEVQRHSARNRKHASQCHKNSAFPPTM